MSRGPASSQASLLQTTHPPFPPFLPPLPTQALSIQRPVFLPSFATMQLFIQSNRATFTLNVAEGATVRCGACCPSLSPSLPPSQFLLSSLFLLCLSFPPFLQPAVANAMNGVPLTLPPLPPSLPPSLPPPQVEQLKAAVEDKEFIPSSLQRLVTGTTTLTAGM
jgi:hypothetical protein